jgi:WD40-like Beta Propeller Repeat
VSRLIAPPSHEPPDAAQVQALFAEARHRRRRRRLAAAVAGLVLAGLAVAVSSGAWPHQPRRGPAQGPGWLPAGPVKPMPSQVVAWKGFKIQVLTSRTGRVVRTLASNVALYQAIPTIAVSPAGVVYFDTARGPEQWIESTPLAGGPITPIGPGDMPAVSPDGRLLAYLAWTVQIYPPGTPARDMKPPVPEAIVVRNLETGAVRRWAFTSDVPAITGLSWSPDNRFLAYTSQSWASGLQPPPDTTQLLDTRAGGTLTSAPRIPLAPGLAWAGFLTPQAGLAVTHYPAAQGRQQTLVAVATRTGRILGPLIRLPSQGLFTSNAWDGTEGTITADPTGRYLLIATSGPHGYGEILRWAIGERHLTGLAAGAIRAAWA